MTNQPESAPVDDIVVRLRERARWLESRSFAVLDGSIEREAADMLEFLLRQVQIAATESWGQKLYRFWNGKRWVHMPGPTIEAAIKRAMKAVEDSRKEST